MAQRSTSPLPQATRLLTWRLLATLLCALAGTVATAQTTVRITGHLVDGVGREVVGARISLLPWILPYEQALLELEQQNDPAPVAVTDSGRDGRFTLDAPFFRDAPSRDLPSAGLWRLRVEAAGFVPLERPLLPLLEDLDLPTLRLLAAVPRRVQVQGTEGRALRGARVVLQSREERYAWTAALRSGWTGRSGRVRLPAAVGETLHLAVWAPGYQERVLTDDRETGRIQGHLEPAVPRGLRVLDPEGVPVAGAVVRVGSGEWPAGVTDRNGYLRLFIGAEGDTPVVAEDIHGRRVRATVQPLTAGAGIDTPMVVQLAPSQELAGRVLDAHGAPLAGALVWPASLPALATRSDARGGFRLTLPARAEGVATTLWAAAPGYRPQREQTQTATVELRLDLSRTVSGEVVDIEGRGIANASVYANNPSDRQATRSLEGGGFQLRGMLSDRGYDVIAQAPGYARALTRLGAPTEAHAQEPLRLVLRRGHLAIGTVTDLDGLPIPGAEVDLLPTGDTSAPGWVQGPISGGSSGARYRVPTDEQGEYRFQHLNPGRYDLQVAATGYAPTRVRGLEISEELEVTDLGTVLLEPGVSLYGRVVNAEEQPLAQVRVKARVASGFRAVDQRGERTTEADGRFRFDDLRSGERLDLQIERDGYLEETVHGVEVPLDATIEITLQRARQLSGRLLSTDAQPIPDATVLLAPLEGTFIVGRQPVGVSARHGTADEETGDFTVNELLPGRYQLRASAPGYLQLERDVEIPVDGAADFLELRLDPGATLTGTVRNSNGAPLSEILVRVVGDGGPPTPFFTDPQQRTEDDGSFRLTGLPPGRHQIEARHGAYLRNVREVEITPGGEHRLDFELQAGATLSGHVTDEAGQAVPDAHLVIRSTTDYKITYSRSDGSFEVTGLSEGEFKLRGSHPDYATTELPGPLQLRGRALDGVTLVLQRGGSVRGQVLGLGFDELAQTSVWATGPGGTVGGSMDFDGKYRIEALAAGEWTIMASVFSDQRFASAQIELTAGEQGYIDVEFTSGYVVSGRVLHADRPITGAPIRLLSDGDVFSGGTGVTDYQGRFEVHHVEAGSYQLSVLHAREGLNYSEGIDVFADLDLEIEIPDQKLRGRVVDESDGRPIERALLRLTPVGGRPGSLHPSAYSDPDGGFEIRGLSAGPWRLQADKAGYASASVDVDIGPGLDTEGVELRLGPASGLTLRILLANGQPADYAAVALLDSQGRQVSAEARDTGEDGRFRLERAPAGSWSVVVTSYGSSTTVRATSPGPVVPVQLPASGNLELHVASLEDRQALVRLRGDDGVLFRTASAVGVRDHWSLFAGRLTLHGVPAGSWNLEISADDGTSRTETIYLGAGEQLEVEVP